MVSRLNEADALFKYTGVVQGDIWGRRSVFYVSDKPTAGERILPAGADSVVLWKV